MPSLISVSKKEKLVGAYVPKKVAEAFALIALANGTTKSGVIVASVGEYVEKHTIEESINSIATELLAHGKDVFVKKASKDILEAFLVEVRLSLHKRGINVEYTEMVADKITELFKEAYAPNETKFKQTKRTTKKKISKKRRSA